MISLIYHQNFYIPLILYPPFAFQQRSPGSPLGPFNSHVPGYHTSPTGCVWRRLAGNLAWILKISICYFKTPTGYLKVSIEFQMLMPESASFVFFGILSRFRNCPGSESLGVQESGFCLWISVTVWSMTGTSPSSTGSACFQRMFVLCIATDTCMNVSAFLSQMYIQFGKWQVLNDSHLYTLV